MSLPVYDAERLIPVTRGIQKLKIIDEEHVRVYEDSTKIYLIEYDKILYRQHRPVSKAVEYEIIEFEKNSRNYILLKQRVFDKILSNGLPLMISYDFYIFSGKPGELQVFLNIIKILENFKPKVQELIDIDDVELVE